jgi:hypothetical protein
VLNSGSPVLTVAVRARPARQQAKRGASSEIAACIAALTLVAAPLPYLLRSDHGHYITALLLTLTLVACSFYSQRGAIAATMVFLAVLGDFRRYAGYFEGYPTSDPLLLVAPVVAVIMLGQALLRGRSAPSTPVSWLLLMLMALMGIEMFNPAQGGVQIGLAGALFYIAPLLWFWVARAFASAQFVRQFTGVIIGVGVAAMGLGLYQIHFGLLAFEQQWVQQVGYQALYISDDIVRSIGFFNSSAEYQRYLVVSAATVFALWMSRRSRVILLLPLFLAAIFLSAARGPVLMVLLAMMVVWAIAARSVVSWLPRFTLAALIGAALLIGALAVLQGGRFGDRVAPLVDRQVNGLLDPANQEKSTATGHLQMLEDGIMSGIKNPAGLGLGATTEAAEKYGGHILNAEVDLANVMIAVGVLGGVLYLAIVTLVLAGAVGWWRRSREPYALALVGTLFGTLGGWLIGAEYSVSALLWFQIGLMDRLSRESRQSPGSSAGAPGPHHA